MSQKSRRARKAAVLHSDLRFDHRRKLLIITTSVLLITGLTTVLLAQRRHQKRGNNYFRTLFGAKSVSFNSAHSRWMMAIEVFNQQGESRQLKLFPSEVEPQVDEDGVARVVLRGVRLERSRQFGSCFLGLEL